MRASPLPHDAARAALHLAFGLATLSAACARPAPQQPALAAPQGCPGTEVLTVDNGSATDVEVYEYTGGAGAPVGTARARQRVEIPVVGGREHYYAIQPLRTWVGGELRWDAVQRSVRITRRCSTS
jgi:hypothetical protein